MTAQDSLSERIAENRACALLRAYSAAHEVGGARGSLLRQELEAVGRSLEAEQQSRKAG